VSRAAAAKPTHPSQAYAAQFADPSVVAAYACKPPYPVEATAILAELAGPRPRAILDLGCGSGDIARALTDHAERIDAVDPAAGMLELGRRRPGGSSPRIRWTCSSAEDFAPDDRYDLVVAAESLHGMEWSVVMPRIASWLRPGAPLCLVLDRSVVEEPWMRPIGALIARRSTNREFRPYDLLEELATRSYFSCVGSRTTTPVPFIQDMRAFIESYHARNGLSRDRMGTSADAFDAELAQISAPSFPVGTRTFQMSARLAWGQPLGGHT
jgi:SAM-dependent methyltransferase